MISFFSKKFLDISDFFHKRKILSFLKKNIDQINTFFDIGAHKGEFLKHIKKIKSIKKVYSLEPQKKIYRELLKEIDNKIFFSYNIAISNRNGRQKMQINDFSMKKHKISNMKITDFHTDLPITYHIYFLYFQSL